VRHTRIIIGAALWLLGCGDAPPSDEPEPLPPIVGEGERVRIATDAVSVVCAGTLAWVDAELDRVEQELKLDGVDSTVDVYLLGATALAERCGPGLYSCSVAGDPAEIYVRAELYEMRVVHELHRQGIPLTHLEASVMLLGIHEDTGSLTYPGSTSYDAEAASYLMAAGADIEVVNQFLQRTLDATQRKLLEALTEHLEVWDVNGQQVAVGWACADDYVDSASVLTHYVVEDMGFRVAVGIISMPVIVRTTEDMLRLVPTSLREGSAALGAQPWRTVTSVIYPAARSGLVTGTLLAIARISGETAPLLFTALNNQFWSTDLTRPMANLPSVIYLYAMSPYENWQTLAWAGALMITLFVLALSVIARSTAALFGGGQRGAP
jgi:hypothetical protein